MSTVGLISYNSISVNPLIAIVFFSRATQQNACGAKIGICRALLNRPEVVSIGVVWDSERPAADQVYSVLKSVGTTLKLSDVFHQISDQRWAQNVEHELVGVVSYYGKHYTTFFFHTKLRVWVYFDDANVKEVGPHWESVVDKCTRGRYQPLLLLYATPQPQQQTPGMQQANMTMMMNADSLTKMGAANNRRAITPSPEKQSMGNTRRAITPTPNRGPALTSDYQNLSVIQSKIFHNEESSSISSSSSPSPPSLSGSYGGGSSSSAGGISNSSSQYQNLSVIQDKIFGGADNSYVTARAWENAQMMRKQAMNLQRSLSAESSAHINDGLSIPDHLNQPRRRDSGNWSGDRNSASSSSSTTLENPYLYLVGKRGVPNSPTRSGSHGMSAGHHFDPGYDSYSLSSTDSYPPKTHNQLLANIPESVTLSSECERLCLEADQMLEKSRLTEEVHDFETAMVLCNAAAGKARQAMDAPYSNPHTMTFARMKHNTCIMRARSLHRRILMEKGMNVSGMLDPKDPNYLMDMRMSQNMAMMSNQCMNGRQTMRPNNTSNNNLYAASFGLEPGRGKADSKQSKTIELYATLPKQKKHQLKLIEAEDIITTLDVPVPKQERESRSIFSRAKRNSGGDDKEKRSRSEDRNKISREFTLANNEPLLANAKDTLKKHKEDKDEKKEKEKPNKKQHKVRRKLLMGGLIRRKNRSMPDLTEGESLVYHRFAHGIFANILVHLLFQEQITINRISQWRSRNPNTLPRTMIRSSIRHPETVQTA